MELKRYTYQIVFPEKSLELKYPEIADSADMNNMLDVMIKNLLDILNKRTG